MIVLIGGAPGVGKSIVASQLSRQLALHRVIDLDILRDVLRMQSREKDDPMLFKNALNAWELMGAFNRKNVIAGFHAHCRPLSGLSFRMVDSYLTTGKSAIFHGAALFPSLMSRYGGKDVHPFIIAATDKDAYRESFIDLHRNRTGHAPKEERIEAGWMLHEELVAEARASGVQVISAATHDKAAAAILCQLQS